MYVCGSQQEEESLAVFSIFQEEIYRDAGNLEITRMYYQNSDYVLQYIRILLIIFLTYFFFSGDYRACSWE